MLPLFIISGLLQYFDLIVKDLYLLPHLPGTLSRCLDQVDTLVSLVLDHVVHLSELPQPEKWSYINVQCSNVLFRVLSR